jgi:outer membrane lipoprotein-sorting protein
MRFQRAHVVLVLATIAAAGPINSASQQDLFDEIYARGKPIETGLKTLTATFKETSTSPLLAEPVVVSGTLDVVRPTKITLQYAGPDARTVLIDGNTMHILWPSRAIDRKTSIGAAQRRIQQYFVAKSPAQLRSHFDVSATVASDRAGTWLVSMTPKRKQIREGITRLELWINQKTIVLDAMRMTFPTGDTKLMEFSNVKLNPDAATSEASAPTPWRLIR